MSFKALLKAAGVTSGKLMLLSVFTLAVLLCAATQSFADTNYLTWAGTNSSFVPSSAAVGVDLNVSNPNPAYPANTAPQYGPVATGTALGTAGGETYGYTSTVYVPLSPSSSGSGNYLNVYNSGSGGYGNLGLKAAFNINNATYTSPTTTSPSTIANPGDAYWVGQGDITALSAMPNPATPGNAYAGGTSAAIIAGTYGGEIIDASTPTPSGFFGFNGRGLITANPNGPQSTQVTVQTRTRAPDEINAKGGALPLGQNLASNVFNIGGMNIPGQNYANDYVLQMDYSTVVDPDSVVGGEIAAGTMYLGIGRTPGNSNVTTWNNALASNVSTVFYATQNGAYTPVATPAVGAYEWNATNTYSSGSLVGYPKPFLGSFASFLASADQNGDGQHYYNHSLDELRGSWGIDTVTHSVWAVLDVGNGIYAVVPEPPTIRLMVAVGLVLTVFAWRRLRSRAERALALANVPSSKVRAARRKVA